MGQQVAGRRRAPEQPTSVADGPAPHALMATVWRGVSAVQGLLGQRMLDFGHTSIDERLSEQLELLAMLHDWLPVTESEAADLVYLLALHAVPSADATRDDVARALIVTIRTMAVRRATGGVKAPEEPGA